MKRFVVLGLLTLVTLATVAGNADAGWRHRARRAYRNGGCNTCSNCNVPADGAMQPDNVPPPAAQNAPPAPPPTPRT